MTFKRWSQYRRCRCSAFINRCRHRRRWREGGHNIAVVVAVAVIAVIAVVVAVAVAVKGAHIDCNGDGNEHGNEFKNFEFVGELIAPTSFFQLNNF